jgi:hypothetical protein
MGLEIKNLLIIKVRQHIINKILRQNNGKFGESYLKAEVIKSVEHNITSLRRRSMLKLLLIYVINF